MANILASLRWVQNQSRKECKAMQLDAITMNGPQYIELLCMIFDKDIRFFADVKKVKKLMSESKPLMQDPDAEIDLNLLQLLKVLSSEEIRGDEAHARCAGFADKLIENEDVEMFLSILQNKTRLGIGATDINKYCKSFKIEQFEVMFAQRMDKIKAIDNTKVYVVQPKIDGNRCICIKKGNEAKFYTRTGKDITSIPHLAELIANVPTDFVLDGEIESGGSLEDTGAIRRKDETIENAVYTIFGVYPINEWESKKHRLPYDRSYKEARRIVDFIDNNYIRMIPSFMMYPISDEEILLFMQRFIDQGYEGAVVKTADHVYQPSAGSKRSKDWIKVKPQESTEGIILDVLEGEGLHQGQAGKFKVKWLDVEFEVAPGKFDHATRIHMLANKQNYIGKRLEFVYQCLSQYNIPRHAYAIKIRED